MYSGPMGDNAIILSVRKSHDCPRAVVRNLATDEVVIPHRARVLSII
jgi:hypothetical protein